MSKMLTNFTFNLLFCCKVSHSGITSSAFSLPLSEKHIGAELASCLPPSPSATIILRYHPTFWPSSLLGGRKGEGRRKRREGGWGTQLLLQHIHGGEARMNQTNIPIGHGIDGKLWFLLAEFTPASIHPRAHPHAQREPCTAVSLLLPCDFINPSPLNPPVRHRACCPCPHRGRIFWCPHSAKAVTQVGMMHFTACGLHTHPAAWQSQPKRLVQPLSRCSCLQNTQHTEPVCGNSSTATDGFKRCGAWAQHRNLAFFLYHSSH